MGLITGIQAGKIAASVIASVATISSLYISTDWVSKNLQPLFQSIVNIENAHPTESRLITGPGHHSGAGPLKGSRSHELDFLETANKKSPQLITNLEKELYDSDLDPRDFILIPEIFLSHFPEINRLSCEMYSSYIDPYRSYGISEENAVDWIEDGRSETRMLPDLHNWTAHPVVSKKGFQFKVNGSTIPGCLAAIHELMHVEEYKPNSHIASEVLTVTRDLINLDLIRKRILGHSVEQEEAYGKTLEIRSEDGEFSKTCSVPLGKYINFYRELEQKKSSLGEAVGSSESIHFLTNCPSRFDEFIGLRKSVQQGSSFDAALDYAKKHLLNPDLEFRNSALLLIKELVKQGQIDQDAIATVIANINKFTPYRISGEVLDLLNEYLMRTEEIGLIETYMLNNIKDSNGNMSAAFAILRQLIKQGKYDESFAIQNGIEYGWTSEGSGLIEELFKKNKGFSEVNAFVRDNIGSKDWMQRTSAFRLLILLNKFEKIEESFFLKQLTAVLNQRDDVLRDLAVKQFEDFLKNGKYVNFAIQYVKGYIKSEQWPLKRAAYSLLALLVEQGQFEEMAMDLAISSMSDPQHSSQDLAFILIPKLMDRRKGIDQFLSYVRKHWNSPEFNLRQCSEKLMSQLAKIGYFPGFKTVS